MCVMNRNYFNSYNTVYPGNTVYYRYISVYTLHNGDNNNNNNNSALVTPPPPQFTAHASHSAHACVTFEMLHKFILFYHYV
jgi:hypothetical protein